ncbi:hypothetical protein [Kluyvera georgiana]
MSSFDMVGRPWAAFFVYYPAAFGALCDKAFDRACFACFLRK